jgi:hypothetical protein
MPELAIGPIMGVMEERYPVSVAGVDLVADRPTRRDARMLRDGEELPRDVWGKYQLTGADGHPHRLELTQSYSHLSPAVRVDDARDAIVLAPLPPWARAIWIVLSVLSAVGLLIHGYLLVWISLPAIFLLTRPGRGSRQVILAGAIGVVALVAQILLFILL